ncbi:MAG: hypothetical protein CL840_17735 [Crocinitomicaceae bacterium]|nr:hypothetical protein [Crocinitomicaceae bacterium]|tara:strand:+ start:16688 stop:17923 length:1236 start_codon:yes stop_codon:yes gene_type:complete
MSIQNESQRQIMLSFAYLAYTGEFMTAKTNVEQTILDNINKAMPKIPPISGSAGTDAWKVVWGPGIYQVPGAVYQDNMMFMVQNQVDTSQFAIAIRGTNFLSDLNWLMEDFDVLQQVPWNYGHPQPGTTPVISEGASIGLHASLQMQGEDVSGNKMTLVECLQNQVNVQGAINVCVTGHSLGGMLCGTMALYLHDNQSTWDSTGNSVISSISFAAPSAGNVDFASYSDEVFSSLTPPPNWDSSLGTNMDRVACSLDAAPLFYKASNITQVQSGKTVSPLFDIYNLPGTGTDGIHGIDFTNLNFVSGAEWIVVLDNILPIFTNVLAPRDYAQVESTATPLAGTFKSLKSFSPPIDISTSDHDNNLSSYMKGFETQVAYQHSDSYPNILGVKELLDKSIIVRNPAPVMANSMG